MQALSYENKNFNLKEPFDGLFTQGMVCHETYKDKENNWVSPEEIETIEGKKYLKGDRSNEIKVGASESMSKSKKNTIDPENIISNYGADAARLFILSDSPPEKDVQWSEEGISSSFKFIQKLWNLNLKILGECKKNHLKDTDNELEKYTNKFLRDVTKNLEDFSYNKIIANMHEMYSFLNKQLNKNYRKITLIENYEKILISIIPIIPHFTSECLTHLNSKNINWPKYDEKMLIEEYVNIVVQINGKKRGLIKTKKDNSEKIIMKEISKEKNLEKYIKDQKIKKKIFIQNRLINIII
tara:strand:- start:180 stop:1073 length:894 start_codon:yes stop_codon:yes gene_type:complete